MKSIYIDSFLVHHYQNDNGFFVAPPLIGLESPEIRNNHYFRPGEDGAFTSSVLYGGRRISLEGFVKASTPAQFDARRRQLISAFSLIRDNNGLITPRVLKFTTMDDLALQCDVNLAAPIRFERRNLTYGRFFIDLESPDFAIVTQSLNNETLEVPANGGTVYPVIYPVEYDPEAGGTEIVVNSGDVYSFPTIYLNGPLNNPIIQNVTTGEYIELMLTISAGQQVVIDTKLKTIVLNGSQNVIQNKTSGSNFFILQPGNNTIKLQTGSGSDTGNLQVQWKDSYLGI